jgi:hypothetical protein
MRPEEKEDQQVRARMQRLGNLIDKELPYGWGFVMLAFPFGKDGRMNYVSNAEREDVVRSMYEFIDASKERWAEHQAEPDSAAEDEQLARARQKVAELEGEIARLKKAGV